MERHEAEAILDGNRKTAVALLLRVGELIEANRRLEARVGELERRLNRSSRNSSFPPSQDPPSAPPRPRRPSSGRTRGGQPGHEGRHRPLLAPERVDAVVEHWPVQCRSCAHVFDRQELVDAADPWRHQVAELPPIAVRVAEHRLHAVRCPGCTSRTRAELPRELPRSAFGPRLQAAVVTLAVRNRVSRRDTTELARELFGVELATGSVDAIVHRAGEALAAPHTRLEQQLKKAPVVNIDETGWKTAGGSRTLWGALSARTAVFRIAAGRHGFEARTLLGERFAGIVCSDRWRGYDYLDPSQRQLCWAHLLRDFTAHSEGMGEQKTFGDDGLRIARGIFTAWRAYQQDGDRARLQAQIAPLQAKLRVLLEHAARKSTRTKYHRLFAKSLLKRWPALWTFAHLDGVEPTNNHAERGLRGAVIYRKLSHGSQSEQGERTIERLLSASITCRLQRRSLFAYLAEVLTANIRGDPIPALA
ncbi:MAG TPA: IS66 family transposase [Gaiellaceae bacterium]|nr:IS66 family transposase [Gaiellaceae bacterium]